jgi:hypothetical protein
VPVARISLSLASALLLNACAYQSADVPSCLGDSCDVVLDAAPLALCKSAADFKTTTGVLKCTPCGEVLEDHSGRGFLPEFIANDALVKKVYMTFEDTNQNKKIDAVEIECPVQMPEIMAKLGRTDMNGTKRCNEISTRVVSETAAPLGKDKADYRAVTARVCDKRRDFGLLFSSFGFSGRPEAKGTGAHIEENGHPGQIEIIAFDQTQGIFNYYKEEDGAMRFFGSSLDFTVAGPGGPELGNTRGCANCHTGGGLVMKELRSPWTHWAKDDNIDGADTLVESRKEFMGTLRSGSSMEFDLTEPGNEAWNETKAKFYSTVTTTALKQARSALRDDELKPSELTDLQRRMLKKGLTATQAMLEPLFCSVQVNINPEDNLSVPPELFAANRNTIEFPTIFDGDDKPFNDAIAVINSRVPGIPGRKELSTEFMVIERSHEDATYVDALVRLKVIDEQLMLDIMMVDFTRPVFSSDRCDLLSFVPDLAPADRKPAKIRDTLIENLRKVKVESGTPGAQLLAHLEANKTGKPFDHKLTLETYNLACSNDRSFKDLVRDALKLRSLQRKLAYRFDGALDSASGTGFHPFAVFEFQQTMPTDDIVVTKSAAVDSPTQVHPDARFHPIDCSLSSTFVPIGPPK